VPNVSIILPTYNRLRFLRPAIESVLEQTYLDWEMIIADDGSNEETAAYLRSLTEERIRTVWLPHSGNPSKVRNCAIDVARGRYLAFLDSDDVWKPTKLEKQIARLLTHADCRWSYTLCDHIDENGLVVARRRLAESAFLEGWIFEPLLKMKFAIAMPTLIADRDLVRDVGGFDEQQAYGEFHDLCLRLAARSAVLVEREALASVRTHDEHYSGDRVAAHAAWMRLYEKMGTLVADDRLRAYCARMRSLASLNIARSQGEKRDFRAARATLARAASFSWRYPSWWYGTLKQFMQPVVPGSIILALQRMRGKNESAIRDPRK
jgi:glycosyltransferase involved in cell wall biosynthesis